MTWHFNDWQLFFSVTPVEFKKCNATLPNLLTDWQVALQAAQRGVLFIGKVAHLIALGNSWQQPQRQDSFYFYLFIIIYWEDIRTGKKVEGWWELACRQQGERQDTGESWREFCFQETVKDNLKYWPWKTTSMIIIILLTSPPPSFLPCLVPVCSSFSFVSFWSCNLCNLR